jgi:hypothetical protein
MTLSYQAKPPGSARGGSKVSGFLGMMERQREHALVCVLSIEKLFECAVIPVAQALKVGEITRVEVDQHRLSRLKIGQASRIIVFSRRWEPLANAQASSGVIAREAGLRGHNQTHRGGSYQIGESHFRNVSL